MYATEKTRYIGRGTLLSGADLSASAGLCAKMSGNTFVLGTDNAAIGVIIDGGTASGDPVSVGRGVVLAKAGGTIGAGVLVSCNASAQIIAAASGDTPIGYSLSHCNAANELVLINITGPYDEAIP